MYRIIPDAATMEQVAALPDDALHAYASVLDKLQNRPWDGEPEHDENPDGAVRRWLFGSGGAGIVVYLIVEREQNEVHLLRVLWAG